MLETLQGINLSFGPLLSTFLIGVSTILLAIWYSARKQTYWKKIGLPYAESYPLLGSIPLEKHVHEVDLRRYRKHGRIFGHYEGNTPLISVGDPDILRNILVKDFQSFTGGRTISLGDNISENMLPFIKGEGWKRLRTIVTPTFTTGKIKRMLNILKECSQTLIQNFKKSADKGEVIDAKKLYGTFSMDVIASSAFSTKIDSHNDPNNEFVKAARGAFGQNWRFLFFVLFPRLMRLLKITFLPKSALNFFSAITLQIIEERKRTGQKGNDFLQLLMDTAKELADEGKLDLNEKDDIVENYGKDENQQVFKQATLTKKTLSHDELVAQCIIFFIAGYETTGATLSYASYCLALNPDVQEKLIQEIDEVVKETKGELTYEAIQGMKYLDNVISETLRMYSPAIRAERMADKDYKLGDTGFTIPKGMVVTVPIYAMHRDPEFFPNPDTFDPDRFTPEEREKRSQYAYLPFGAGPRNCVGMRFALMETKVCLAHVLRHFRFKKCSQTKVPLEFEGGLLGLLQSTEIALKLEARKDTRN